MKKSLSTRLCVAGALVALAAPLVSLNAQNAPPPATVGDTAKGGRGRGGGRGGGAPATPVPPPTSPVTGNATAGKGLYYAFGCYACHGYNGETGARPFVGRWGNLATEQTFLTFLRGRANVAPVTPSTNMPNFSEASVSDKQAKDIYAYIRSFKSSAPAELKDAPALTAIIDSAKQDKK
ncbi:MAG TPA: c-type cytochrome [Bryobacteraceae bacterium]|jgi:mono/diheme cytochrome c family protein